MTDGQNTQCTASMVSPRIIILTCIHMVALVSVIAHLHDLESKQLNISFQLRDCSGISTNKNTVHNSFVQMKDTVCSILKQKRWKKYYEFSTPPCGRSIAETILTCSSWVGFALVSSSIIINWILNRLKTSLDWH